MQHTRGAHRVMNQQNMVPSSACTSGASTPRAM
jgi:hypothetical protein